MTERIGVNIDGHMQQVDLATAQWIFGSTMLHADAEPAPDMLGEVQLLPHQRDAVPRVQAAIREFGGALLADEVGLGKTYVALAVASRYAEVHVIAPAGLLPMWRSAIARCGLTNVKVHSLHACSQRVPNIEPVGTLRFSPEAPHTAISRLVVIDEAHHLRTPNTRRYRHVADAIVGCDVLLLSATPIHNRVHDLRTELRLFMGSRADAVDAGVLARVVVRRSTAIVHTSLGSSVHKPVELVHAPVDIPFDRDTLSAIMQLPAPLPARDGAVAGALIRIGLLRAWCSSDAALAAAVSRRRLRGLAMRDALVAGRHPTATELRTWLVGDGEVQLAFPELAAAHEVQPDTLLPVLDTHLDALAALHAHHRRHAIGDASRANALREILQAGEGAPVVAFSQFSSTIAALYRALSDIAGVAMLTSGEARIASGRVSRREVLHRFAPDAHGVPPPSASGRVRLLLATDLLAEGVNLQDAAVIVHLDLPWTDALRQQRVGRVARIGSRHASVDVHTFAAPEPGERALRQLERLLLKSTLASEVVGGSDRSAADDASAIRRTLSAWCARGDTGNAHAATMLFVAVASGALASKAHATADEAAALVLVHDSGEWRLLACADIVSTAVADVRRCVEAIQRDTSVGAEHLAAERLTVPSEASPAPASPIAGVLDCALNCVLDRVLDRVHDWHGAQQVRAAAGASSRSQSTAQHRAERRVHAEIAAVPAVHRPRVAVEAERALQVIRASRGDAAELALAEWAAEPVRSHGALWLRSWSQWPALRAPVEAETPWAVHAPASSPPLVRAVILLHAPE